MNFKYQVFFNYSNEEGTFIGVISNRLCDLNFKKVPPLNDALLQADDRDTVAFIKVVEEYVVFYIHTTDDIKMMFFIHHSLNMETLKNNSLAEVVLEYEKEIKEAQKYARATYQGENFTSINFAFVETNSPSIN